MINVFLVVSVYLAIGLILAVIFAWVDRKVNEEVCDFGSFLSLVLVWPVYLLYAPYAIAWLVWRFLRNSQNQSSRKDKLHSS